MRSHACLAFCCGLVVVATQTLLLRECIAVLAGGDLWIGVFLAASLLGAAAGAFLYRKIRTPLSRLGAGSEALVLLSIPIMVLQFGMVVLLTAVAAESRSILPLGKVLAWLVLIAGPGGLLAGLFFPILCRRPGGGECSSISAVGALGAAGGAFGGVAAIALSHVGMSTIQGLLTLGAILCGSVVWATWSDSWRRAWRTRAAVLACSAVMLGAVGFRVDVPLTRITQTLRWSRFVPTGILDGSFRTRQAEYLYGLDGDRWVVVGPGGVSEVVGDRTQAGRIAAIALAQNFTAERILVIGDGLSVCERFLLSSNVKAVDWFCPDREYSGLLQAHLPERFRVSDPRLRTIADDIQATLAERPETYDVVIVNLPAVADASYHRFVAAGFLGQVRKSLRPLGLVVVGVTGDRNTPGSEPAWQGAWVESTLEAVFSQSLLVPTDERTFFLVSAGGPLEVSPINLETRFGLVENAGEIFPVESLAAVYHPDRSLQMLPSYDAVDLPRAQLVNSDDRPGDSLCSLLRAAGRSGLSLTKPARSILRGGLPMLIIPVLLFAFVRLAYVVRTAPRAKTSIDPQCGPTVRSDVLLLCGCASMAGVVVLVLLANAWLASCDSAARCLGPAFSLFLGGLALGAACARWAVSRLHPKGPIHLRSVLLALGALLAIHAGCLAVCGFVLDSPVPLSVLGVLLALYGFLGGAGVTLGTKVLGNCGDATDSAAACLVGAGSIGGAAGGLASLLVIPLIGFDAVLYFAAALVLGTTILAGAAYRDLLRPGRRVLPHPWLTPIGYALFAAVLSVIVGVHVFAYKERSQSKSQATVAIQDWVQGRRVSARTVASAVTGQEAAYQEVREGSQLKGYIFRSEDFSGTVYGYGGPMSVVVFADPAGNLIDFRITRSRETPRYISRIRDWMTSLKGKAVFGPAPMQGVNAVSGATLSCNAILRLLRDSGRQFDASVLSGAQVVEVAGQEWFERVDWLVVYWAGGIVLALAAIFHGRLWSRLAVLVFTAGVGGFWLNRQYSTDHVMRLLSGQGLLDSPLAVACLLLGVPLVALLLGNIYCGYLCPFGAVQELLSFVVPKRFKVKPSLPTVTAARSIKYAVLFTLVGVFFLAGSKRFLELDPLTLFFSRQFWSEGLAASPGLIPAVLILFGALVVTRVWCRYLCPTGAFLSLFNLAGWLGRFLPAKKFGRCEFGLGGRDHLDCIHCDRCRYECKLVPARADAIADTTPNPASWTLVLILLGVLVWTLMPIISAN